MTAIDRFGAARLAAIVGALALVLVLHLVRSPLLLAARVVEVSMRRVDAFATRQAAYPLTSRKEPRRGSHATR
jgi:hypothetical protein